MLEKGTAAQCGRFAWDASASPVVARLPNISRYCLQDVPVKDGLR
jgi:hypothetical protein